MQFGISEAIEHWSTYQPHALAIVADGKRTTYRDLNKRIDRLARSLSLEFNQAKRVGVLVLRKPDFLAAVIAILRIRKSAVVLNQVLDIKGLTHCATEAGVKAIVYDSDFVRKNAFPPKFLLERSAKDISGLGGSKSRGHTSSFESATPKDEWGVFYSSGTTGLPKGIIRDHYSVVTEMLGWCLELGLGRDTYFYVGRPLYYTGGLLLSLSSFLMGGTIGIDSEGKSVV